MTENINYNEVGAVIRVNLKEDITLSTPTLIIEPEYGDKKEITDGVTIPDIDYITDDETFCAGEYIEYSTKDGDIDYVGKWRKKASLYFDSDNVKQSDYQRFYVLP